MTFDLKTVIRLNLAAAALLGASLVLAQGGMGPGPGASAPGMRMAPGASAPGMGMGMGPGGGMGRRSGDGVTPGWSMMTPEERNAHHAAMAGMTSMDECNAYRDKHHQQMAERAKQRGQAMPGAPRQDVCAGLKK